MTRSNRRLSLRSIMVSVAIGAVGLSFLRKPTEHVAGGLFSLTLATLLIVVLLARYGPARQRPYAWGFAVCGWSYLALSLAPVAYVGVRPALLTTFVLDECHRAWVDDDELGHANGGRPSPYSGYHHYLGPVDLGFAQPTSYGLAYQSRQLGGHSLFALLAGVVGGSLVAALSQTSAEPSHLRSEGPGEGEP